MFAATLFSIPSYCGDWSLVWVVYSRHWDVFPQFANQFMVLLPKFAEIVCVCLSPIRGVSCGVAELTHIGESV